MIQFDTGRDLCRNLSFPKSNPQTSLDVYQTHSGEDCSRQTLMYSVNAAAGQIFSTACRPFRDFHSGGGIEPAGWNSGANVNVSNSCNSRTRK